MRTRIQLRSPQKGGFLSPSRLIILFLGCLLLLSACTGGNKAEVRKAKLTRPAVNNYLQQQAQAEILTFQKWLSLMQQYKGDMGKYRQEYDNDQQALLSAKTDMAYQSALQDLNKHVSSVRSQAFKVQMGSLEHQLSQQASDWSKQHTYHNKYDGITYHMGYEYGSDGAGGWLHDSIAAAETLADYQQVVEDAQTFLTSFQAYQANAIDKTPWNKAHATDLQLIQHYNYTSQKVVVISLNEQAMRIYDNGNLVKAFQVTTGRPEKPSLPGSWEVENKQAPTVFKSSEPPGSAYWYPNTPINYAMLYHSDGYFIHDSWWRTDYGPTTQFPHADSSGDSFSFNGSHGCVNLATSNAAWLYNYVAIGTQVLIY